MESAIFLFSRVARIPEGSTVLPAIVTEEVITLGAELENGAVINGQNCISHPNIGAAGGKPGNAIVAGRKVLGSPQWHAHHLALPPYHGPEQLLPQQLLGVGGCR